MARGTDGGFVGQWDAVAEPFEDFQGGVDVVLVGFARDEGLRGGAGAGQRSGEGDDLDVLGGAAEVYTNTSLHPQHSDPKSEPNT